MNHFQNYVVKYRLDLPSATVPSPPDLPLGHSATATHEQINFPSASPVSLSNISSIIDNLYSPKIDNR